MNNHASVPVGVLGASGYVGQELLRLLRGHPGANVAFATAESAAGEWVEGHELIKADDAPWQEAEIVLSALPHGVSGRYVHEARAGGKRAVDLSADFRLSPEAVYGLTEFTRPRLADADLVANPGCYPTAALLALIPLAQLGLIDVSREIIIDAGETDRVETRRAQGADEQAIDRPTQHHFDNLGYFGRRHAHAVAFLDGQSEAPRPRADGMTPAVHHDDRTRPPECPRAFSDPFRTIELVAADFDDAHRQHASPAVSGSPSITFMF